jgi:hypothetical protein
MSKKPRFGYEVIGSLRLLSRPRSVCVVAPVTQTSSARRACFPHSVRQSLASESRDI